MLQAYTLDRCNKNEEISYPTSSPDLNTKPNANLQFCKIGTLSTYFCVSEFCNLDGLFLEINLQ